MSENAATETSGTVRAADWLVDFLVAQGVEHVFGVPGESYIAALDAMYGRKDIDFVSTRHEGGAAMAACAYAMTRSEVGVCMVTRGPGATNASAGIHVAQQDSIPLVLFVGQVESSMRGREAFQEVAMVDFFRPISKWAVEIDDPDRLPEILARAFATAQSGRPGPVVVSLPEELLHAEIENAAIDRVKPVAPVAAQRDISATAALLEKSERPVLIAGGAGWNAAASTALDQLARALSIPVVAAFRRQDILSNDHPCYAGYLGLGGAQSVRDLVQKSDLVISVSARLGEATTGGYTLFDIPKPQQTLVHVFPDAEELGRVYRPDIGIVASAESFLTALAMTAPARRDRWVTHCNGARAAFEDWSSGPDLPVDLQLSRLFMALNDRAPKGTIVTNGAGNYTAWLHRFFRYDAPKSQLAPTCGSMGYGIPAALGAAIAQDDAPVVAVAGDGCFMMTANELATLKATGRHVIIIVVNNSTYGSIRMHQERGYPGRQVGTSLSNPDFVAFAKSFGFDACRISQNSEIDAAIEGALNSRRCFLIEAVTDPNAISPSKLLGS
jgi:acetolactate synthase-1/2/3 large subunit